jgi:hypothetical protein
MRRFCAWCQTPLDDGPREIQPGEDVSHGICPECQACFFGEQETGTLEDLLDRLEIPVLVLDGNVRVQTANRKALQVLNADLPRLRSRFGGEVLECARARLPGGCGQTEHCPACAIRGSVESTYRTGVEHKDVVAEALLHGRPGPDHPVQYLISTRKIGDAVLLRIDRVGDKSFRREP